MMHALGLILLIAGLIFGGRLPDIDQSIGFLLHRSIITHGPLVPFLVFTVASNTKSIPLRWFAVGLGLGFAVHLAFDLFPRDWTGYALISLPIFGRTPPAFSWVWVALSTILCAYLTVRLTRGCLEVMLFILGAIGFFIATALHEDALWGPAVTAIVAIGITVKLARPLRGDDSR